MPLDALKKQKEGRGIRSITYMSSYPRLIRYESHSAEFLKIFYKLVFIRRLSLSSLRVPYCDRGYRNARTL